MPGIGEQHNTKHPSVNPYEEVKSHVSEYTAQEIATLSSRLEKQLGPEYISTRPGASGTKVPYLAADKCINLANEVFGFNGWSSGIQQIQIDFVDESQSTGKVSLGLSVIVRVTLRDGTYHEDIGYGHIENCKGKAAAFEKAKKEGTTDGLKRALRNFGNILGNCVYDKEYISKVTKIRVAPSRWDPDNLHRHPDYAPLKKEPSAEIKTERVLEDANDIKAPPRNGSGEPEDEFASQSYLPAVIRVSLTRVADDFDEVDFSVNHEIGHEDPSLEHTCPSNGRERTPSKTHVYNSRAVSGQLHPSAPSTIVPQKVPAGNYHGPPTTSLRESRPIHDPSLQVTPPRGISSTVNHNPPVGFFTARVAETVQNSSGIPLEVSSFNPHLESPSIRKTAGVDHSKTKPVGKDIIGPPQSPASAMNAAATGRSNFVNPQVDKTRRVGMPIGAASPLSNRGSYKPPQMKRDPNGNPVQQPRLALGDVPSTTLNVPSDSDGGDVKRQRTGASIPQSNVQHQGQVTT
ncbi:MAG: hypothetical protein LQ346_000704 [Caloplaca aetnensis]|nr:MAG: hypothetical protein LQ346_000704 [Caloplaca aetnensis]